MPTSSLTLQRLVDVTLGGDFALVPHNGPAPSPPPPHVCPTIPGSVLFFDDFRGMAEGDFLQGRVPVVSPAETPWDCSPSVAVADTDDNIQYQTNDGSWLTMDPDGVGMLDVACIEIKFLCLFPQGVIGFVLNFSSEETDNFYQFVIFTSGDESHPDNLSTEQTYTNASGGSFTKDSDFPELGSTWITFRVQVFAGALTYFVNGTPYIWTGLGSVSPLDFAANMHMTLQYGSSGPETGPIVISYLGASTNPDEDFVSLLCKNQ